MADKPVIAIDESLLVPDPAELIRILCVDDEASILNALKRLFRGKPYKTVTFDTAHAALEYLDESPENRVDVVISDMRMPGMDGLEFLSLVAERYPEIGRIVLSGYADLESVISVVNRAHINSYVTKPWDEFDLKLKVEQLAQTRYYKCSLERVQKQRQLDLEVMNDELEAKVEKRTAALRKARDHLQKTVNDLEESHRGAVKMIAYFAEQGWPGLQPHAEGVAKLTSRFVYHLGIDKRQAEDIVIAARLHDIGLAVLDQEIVHKPWDELTPEEREHVEKHSILGEQTLMGMPVMKDVAAMVRSHHESFCGDGYPDKLKGAMIPFGARIIRLVNDYTNMLDGLRLEHAYSKSEALDIIGQNSFGQYDPKLAESFVKMMRGGDRENHLGNEQIWALPVGELRPGMALYENLLSKDGMILLTAGQVLTDRMIANIRHVEQLDKDTERKIAVLVPDEE